jgi:protein HOOK3
MTPNSSLLQWLATFQLGGQPAVELKNDAYYNLADGYVCARILNQISPVYFTDKWLDGIKPVPPNGSWRLRVSNLKRILQKIHDYASDLQSSQFMLDAINPDVTVIAQNFEPDQICRLIQLILFCAINCDKKQDYIEKIRDLPTQVKQDIKEAIEELLVKNELDNQHKGTRAKGNHLGNESVVIADDDDAGKLSQNIDTFKPQSSAFSSPARSATNRIASRNDNTHSDINKRNDLGQQDASTRILNDSNESVDEIRRKLNDALLLKEEKAQACHELEMKLKQLQLERDQLLHENEKLVGERSANITKNNSNSRRQSETNRDLELSGQANNLNTSNDRNKLEGDEQIPNEFVLAQNRRLQNELQRLKEELIRVEAEKEDYRLKSNLLKEDLDKITLRHEELRSKAEQAKRLQDELDEHKHITEKVISYETMVENLVKKNNEMKKELKSLKEKNMAHVQTIVCLEQENQQLVSTVNQVDVYRRQLNDAQIQLSQETHRADQAEVELARIIEKLKATKKENEKLYEAANQLKRNSSSTSNQQDEVLGHDNMFDHSNHNKDTLTDKEVDRVNDDLNSIPSDTMDLKERIVRLEMENQLLKAKVVSESEASKSVLGRLLEEATDKCKRLESENQQVRKKVLYLESKLRDLTNQDEQPTTSTANLIQEPTNENVVALIKRVEDLQRLLYQREQELRDAEIRYKKNIDKAKEVMKALNSNQSMHASLLHPSCMSSASFNSSSLDETHVLKQQLREKEERLIALERDFFEFKKEVHERLIQQSYDGMSAPVQWKDTEKRLERAVLNSTPTNANPQISQHHS